MPIPPSPEYLYELSLSGKIKQCQNSACLVRETETQSLFTCAGCKRSRYCSKECQKGDWKLHKPLCIVAQHDRQRHRQAVKDATQCDKLKLICGLNEQQAEILSKKWAQQFQGVILKAAYMALDVYHFPDRTYTHILSIILDPNFTENNIPRKDAEIANAFAFIDARVRRWSDFGMDREKYPQLKAVFDKAEDVQSKLDGGTKVAFAVLHIPVLFRIFRVCPLALVGPAPMHTAASDSLEWKAILNQQINRGLPIF